VNKHREICSCLQYKEICSNHTLRIKLPRLFQKLPLSYKDPVRNTSCLCLLSLFPHTICFSHCASPLCRDTEREHDVPAIHSAQTTHTHTHTLSMYVMVLYSKNCIFSPQTLTRPLNLPITHTHTYNVNSGNVTELISTSISLLAFAEESNLKCGY